ncbi:MAG: hypothetical protein H7Y31_13190, partial [Chitinophagaceae bacterium]|nr:hypothetical protein [Chitinophagaceae bacterium]
MNQIISSKLFRKAILVCLFVSAYSFAVAQTNDNSWLDVSKIRFQKLLSRECDFAESPKKVLTLNDVATVQFQNDSFRIYNPNLPLRIMERTFLVRLNLENSSDTLEELYFTPGYHFRDMILYKADAANIPATIQVIPDSLIRSTTYPGSKLLRIQPGERAVFIAS